MPSCSHRSPRSCLPGRSLSARSNARRTGSQNMPNAFGRSQCRGRLSSVLSGALANPGKRRRTSNTARGPHPDLTGARRQSAWSLREVRLHGRRTAMVGACRTAAADARQRGAGRVCAGQRNVPLGPTALAGGSHAGDRRKNNPAGPPAKGAGVMAWDLLAHGWTWSCGASRSASLRARPRDRRNRVGYDRFPAHQT